MPIQKTKSRSSRSTGKTSVPAPADAGETPAAPIKKTRVLLADDHPVVRRGIALCLAGHERLEVVGEATNGDEVIRKARELSPDVILMDVDMPRTSGLSATEALRNELPNVKVLILSVSNNKAFVPRIIKSGARGYVQKDASTEELIRAIEVVESGDTFFSHEMAQAAVQQWAAKSSPDADNSELTQREEEVLVGIAKGLSNKEIASQLNIGTRTVETHRENLMRKLDIHSIGGLTQYAVTHGLITLGEGIKL